MDNTLNSCIELGAPVDLSNASIETVKDYYQSLLIETLKARASEAGKEFKDVEDYIQSVLDWVDSTDFYDAPASTIYHESFKHGLVYHTLSVYNNMLDLLALPKFSEVALHSASLCCLIHDWCKIGLYESYKRNVKDEKTGQWNSVDAYRRKSFPHPFGHGAASMYIAMKMFKLTESEALAIRWHMGMFNVASNEINEFQQSCERYPEVLLLQFADHLSITEY